MVDIIMSGPQHIECRDCDQDPPTGRQQTASMFEGGCRIGQVFQYVQHEDQIKSLAWLKTVIEGLPKDPIAPRTVRCQRRFVRFDAEDTAEPRQAGKQQAVAAANIQNPG